MAICRFEGRLRSRRRHRASWPESDYEQSEYLQVETELEELKGDPRYRSPRHADRGICRPATHRQRGGRAACARERLPEGPAKDVCEALALGLRNALGKAIWRSPIRSAPTCSRVRAPTSRRCRQSDRRDRRRAPCSTSASSASTGSVRAATARSHRRSTYETAGI